MTPLEIKSDTEPDKQLRFHMLLDEIFMFFINIPIDQVDNEIEVAQHRICEFLDLDRSTLLQVSKANPKAVHLTHVYQPPGIRKPAGRMTNVQDLFPWSIQKIMDGETVIISRMTDFPAEAKIDVETFSTYGTKSVVIIPLSVEKGTVFGMLSFTVMREEREWESNVVQRFKVVAQIFANVLARQQAEQSLLESEKRLNMALNAAEAGIWVMTIDTGCIWVTPKTQDLFHFDPDEALNYESFFKVVHPKDRDRVHQAVQQALQSGEGLWCEYQIILSNENTRWILSTGHRQLGSTGESDRMMGMSVDITERKLAEQALAQRLRFETLLGEMSVRFVNLPADRLDSEIADALCRICELLDLDLAVLWQWSGKVQDSFTPTHVYSSQGGPAPSEMNQEYFPWYIEQIKSDRIVSFSSLDELPAEAARDRESCRLFGVKSNLTFPLSVGGSLCIGILGFNTMETERDWPEELVKRLQLVTQVFTNALDRKRMEVQLQKRFREIDSLKQRLESENFYLQKELRSIVDHADILGQSVVVKKMLAEAEQVAETDATVLILGETGTGKGLLAKAIHRMSLRKDRTLIKVNCAALPPTLIESELFGREKGAFTGATTKMIGRFEIADGSTLFLDEIGELSIDLQSKLLRVLEEGAFERLGSAKTLRADVRIIAATNRDLWQEVKDGKFREDLFYRLNVFPIKVPPLRERPEDIPLLVRASVKKFQKKLVKEIERIPKKTLKALQAYTWPGNVRELNNIIERAMILSKDKILHINLPDIEASEIAVVDSFEDMARRHIISALDKTRWRIAGKGGAAELLGLKRGTLHSKMKSLGIKRSIQAMTK